jgi:peptidoglycan/xylan/chitin deacetylase (PgdA/CDA1 family)
MLSSVRKIIRTTDAAAAGAYLSLFRERNALLCFLFHSVFLDDRESRQNRVHPLQRTTVAQFRAFVRYYQAEGYQFIRPSDLFAGLDPDGKYALITFDDGYFNNTRALPILEEFAAPATFFITTDNVQRCKSFWWDVHWRESAARGMSHDAIVRDGRALKSMTTEQIEEELLRRHGRSAFAPRGDLDRPFTPTELRDFSRHPLVGLGNHTANHAILSNYSARAGRQQIAGAQEAIQSMTGLRPVAIAYPNGAHSTQIQRWCVDAGLKCGFTIEPRKTALPLDMDSQAAMRIGRFMPDGDEPIQRQCRTFRSDVQLYGKVHAGFRRLSQYRTRYSLQSETSAQPSSDK